MINNILLLALCLWVSYEIATRGLFLGDRKVKGSFTVKGYKNGELVYQETLVDCIYQVGPGDKYDKIEIVN